MEGLKDRGERGATSVEYGLVAVAIAALVVTIVFLLGDVVQELFFNSCEEIRDKAAPTESCS